MNAIVTPYPEPNVEMMAIYEELYYDDIDVNHTFPKPKKYVRQFNMPLLDTHVGFDFEPTNLTSAFSAVSDDEHHINDLIANVSACYPAFDLKTIATQLNHIYTDSKTMEAFVPGQRVGDYEYIVSEINYCVILFGRKRQGDDYFTLHCWLK